MESYATFQKSLGLVRTISINRMTVNSCSKINYGKLLKMNFIFMLNTRNTRTFGRTIFGLTFHARNQSRYRYEYKTKIFETRKKVN